jgi:uncharacterized protein
MTMKPRHWLSAAAVAAAALAAYATLIEPRWLQVRRARIHIRSLPPALEGLRVGLISDIHLEGSRPAALARRAVAAIARERPDLVAITGDLAEDRTALQTVLDALTTLDAPLGVWVVPGNHDHRAGIDHWRRAVAARKAIQDLTNRYVLLQRDGATLCIAGIDDHIEGQPLLLLPPPGARDLTIVLAHSPDQAERCRRSYDAVDLILSGHTHGGQVRLPFFGATVHSVAHADLYQDGLRRRPWTQVYTSRGIGTSRLPIRFMARPEVSILELTGGARPARHARYGRSRARARATPRPRSPSAPSLELQRDATHIPLPARQGRTDTPSPRGTHENP